uniref:Cuta protein n=1 Tax=Mus musculus TaxID=10090 RepID=Q8VC83_MOUSE|nr:Cuta protein [Mus musculus]
MPALLPVASRLLLLPRALLSMASGSPPSQPPPASGSGYVPGSVSAAFVTCPNEKVAKEIASGREASGSLRQPHPADHIHL